MNHDELFDKFLQRSLTASETAELKRLLRADPEAGRRFVEHIQEASLIIRAGTQVEQAASGTADIVSLPTAPVTPAAPAARAATRWRWAALAAGVIVAAGLAWWVRPRAMPLQASLANANGEVTIQRGDKVIPAEPGLHLQAEDVVQTAPQSRAVVVFDGEATRLELQSDSRSRFSTTRRGRRVELAQGTLEATVAPQPKGRFLVCNTLHAEAKVVGTRFLLASEVSSTRLEVTDGAVQFTRRADGQSLVVRKGNAAVASPNVEFAVRPFLPPPWASQDIGAVGLAGQGRFDGRTFRLRGAGQDSCCTKDQFHFTHQALEGDGEILACVRDVEFTDPEAKAMLMVRQSLKSASPQVSIGVTAAGGLEVEHRARTDSRIERVGHAWTPCWLRLSRQGDVVSAYHSVNGSDWVFAGAHTNSMPNRVYVGLGVTSYNHASLSTATFENVRVNH